MEKKNLLSSKSYGLSKYKFWKLANTKIVKQLGFAPLKEDLHTNMYEHQLEVGDIFVSMALTGKLLAWESEVQLTKELRTDIIMRVSDEEIYIEVERGNQTKWKLVRKFQNYLNYYEQTKEFFYVLFVVPSEIYGEMRGILSEMNLRAMYRVVLLDEFLRDPLNAPMVSQHESHTLSQLCPDGETA